MIDTDTETAVAREIRVTCDRDDLATRVGVVARAVSSRSSVQVLSGIRISATESGIELAATDMELSLRTSVAGTTAAAGTVVVPAKLLSDIVRLLPAGAVELSEQDNTLCVTAGAYSSRLNTYAAEDFPKLPPVDAQVTALDATSLLDTIERVSRAASRDESRPVLTGILVRFEGTTLVMAATDSYRLSVKETALPQAGPELEAIIPARALAELQRLAAGAETVDLAVHENHVVFHVGGVWLTTRRIDGQFPDVKKLLPETFEVELSVPRAELLEVVRRAAVLAQRNTPLRLCFAEGELTVSAQSQDVGETRETMPVAYTGEPLEIGFNADFLREGLESVSTDDVALKLINPLRPGLITADSEAFWYLIMPIRLAG
ncbi:MAG TPA: DNA polymerase III subunit beta [Gaiellaceae bacterium]|nr:DNA polymerase III subunit beta [Gaiellaceae bacterium]